jgi:hypothetical protein
MAALTTLLVCVTLHCQGEYVKGFKEVIESLQLLPIVSREEVLRQIVGARVVFGLPPKGLVLDEGSLKLERFLS